METISKNLKSSKKRSRRKFSFNEKQKIYEEWETSGLNKIQFCKQRDLAPSVFSRWCHQLSSRPIHEAPKDNWIPVVLKGTSHKEGQDEITVEMTLPNKIGLKFMVKISCLNALLKELYHATPTIW